MQLATFLSTAALMVASTSALGINCRGSGDCPLSGGSLNNAKNYASNIDGGRHYNNGDKIVCDANLCCFYQQTSGGGTAGQAVGLIQQLIGHGCKGCGSVPTQPGNNVRDGELTCNYVEKTCDRAPGSNGVCA